jgi:hypothetical protein
MRTHSTIHCTLALCHAPPLALNQINTVTVWQHKHFVPSLTPLCCASVSSFVLQDGFVEDPAPVADRANFDYTAYADSNALMGPVSAIYYTAAAAQ